MPLQVDGFNQASFFDAIIAARYDTSALGPADLLKLDYKQISVGGLEVGFAAVFATLRKLVCRLLSCLHCLSPSGLWLYLLFAIFCWSALVIRQLPVSQQCAHAGRRPRRRGGGGGYGALPRDEWSWVLLAMCAADAAGPAPGRKNVAVLAAATTDPELVPRLVVQCPRSSVRWGSLRSRGSAPMGSDWSPCRSMGRRWPPLRTESRSVAAPTLAAT
jgi:hypothetical protein